MRCWKVSAPNTKPDSTPSVLSPSIPPAQALRPLPRHVTGGPRAGPEGRGLGRGWRLRTGARVLEGVRVSSSPGRTILGSAWLRYRHAGKILFMGSLRQLMVVRIRIAWQYFNITDMSHLGFLTVLYYTIETYKTNNQLGGAFLGYSSCVAFFCICVCVFNIMRV